MCAGSDANGNSVEQTGCGTVRSADGHLTGGPSRVGGGAAPSETSDSVSQDGLEGTVLGDTNSHGVEPQPADHDDPNSSVDAYPEFFDAVNQSTVQSLSTRDMVRWAAFVLYEYEPEDPPEEGAREDSMESLNASIDAFENRLYPETGDAFHHSHLALRSSVRIESWKVLNQTSLATLYASEEAATRSLEEGWFLLNHTEDVDQKEEILGHLEQAEHHVEKAEDKAETGGDFDATADSTVTDGGVESGQGEEAVIVNARANAIVEYGKAWEHAQAAIDLLDDAHEPDIEITSQSFEPEDGYIEAEIRGQIRDINPREYGNVSVYVNGEPHSEISPTYSISTIGSGSFETSLELQELQNNVTVVIEDGTQSASDSWTFDAKGFANDTIERTYVDPESNVTVSAVGEGLGPDDVKITTLAYNESEFENAGPQFYVDNRSAIENGTIHVPLPESIGESVENASIVKWEPDGDAPWTLLETSIDAESEELVADVEDFSIFWGIGPIPIEDPLEVYIEHFGDTKTIDSDTDLVSAETLPLESSAADGYPDIVQEMDLRIPAIMGTGINESQSVDLDPTTADTSNDGFVDGALIDIDWRIYEADGELKIDAWPRDAVANPETGERVPFELVRVGYAAMILGEVDADSLPDQDHYADPAVVEFDKPLVPSNDYGHLLATQPIDEEEFAGEQVEGANVWKQGEISTYMSATPETNYSPVGDIKIKIEIIPSGSGIEAIDEYNFAKNVFTIEEGGSDTRSTQFTLDHNWKFAADPGDSHWGFGDIHFQIDFADESEQSHINKHSEVIQDGQAEFDGGVDSSLGFIGAEGYAFESFEIVDEAFGILEDGVLSTMRVGTVTNIGRMIAMRQYSSAIASGGQVVSSTVVNMIEDPDVEEGSSIVSIDPEEKQATQEHDVDGVDWLTGTTIGQDRFVDVTPPMDELAGDVPEGVESELDIDEERLEIQRSDSSGETIIEDDLFVRGLVQTETGLEPFTYEASSSAPWEPDEPMSIDLDDIGASGAESVYVELHHDASDRESLPPWHDPGHSLIHSDVLEVPDDEPPLPPPPPGDGDVTIVNVDDDSAVDFGDPYTATVTVRNEEDEVAGDVIQLRHEGTVVDSAPVELDPDDETSVTLVWSGYEEEGTYTVQIVSDADQETREFTVRETLPPGPLLPASEIGSLIVIPGSSTDPGSLGIVPAQ